MAVRILGIIFSACFSFACGLLGYAGSQWYLEWYRIYSVAGATTANFYGGHFTTVIILAFVALGLLVGFVVATFIYRKLSALMSYPAADKIAAVAGLVAGLVVAALLGPFLNLIQLKTTLMQSSLVTLIYLLCVYGGITLALSMKTELAFLLARPLTAVSPLDLAESVQKLKPKLLDTNVIIDGRIADICRAGFVEGIIYIPGFVLEELQLIADSSDNLRRARGRRGLDVLGALQKELKVVRVYDHYKTPMPRSEAVDSKLVRLAKELEAVIITNDFNLNKVASLQGIIVLNVNELAAALKPVVLPGEEMVVNVAREGKELNQGVAYLDDGTMVVIEGGKPHISQNVTVVVSSVLQTVAGKMIFASMKLSNEPAGSYR